ncbi:matrixin family metalloprotease [Paenibacillus sp. Y412MC10]|uniref:matrixin family metalloprotease n=1 Tax=Geobacillus sp. (strain Y412MC10) TaxID=481743 RepID=UPI00119CC7BA|nr:snapalysin family zinc-dependent metalloprotease [Paenibacillus sp. Y412MC10]
MKRKLPALSIKKKLVSVMIVASLPFTFNLTASATAYVQSWDLVDSGKHLDYDGNSMYMSYVTKGASIWNGYKSGIIRPDSASVIEDVFVSDVNVVNGNTGVTYSSGYIELNYYNLQNCTANQITNTATHELGHALGLDHSTSSDIMGPSQTSLITLSRNDKDSYDAAYLYY